MPTVKKSYGRHHDLDNPHNVAVSKIIFRIDGFSRSMVKLSNTRFFIFTDLFHRYLDIAGGL